jgi:hypothetical protein
MEAAVLYIMLAAKKFFARAASRALIPAYFPLSVSAGRDTSLFLKRRKAMLPLPLPPNPLNPFGIVSSTIAVTATVAGLGVGLTLGAAMLATCSMMSRRR